MYYFDEKMGLLINGINTNAVWQDLDSKYVHIQKATPNKRDV